METRRRALSLDLLRAFAILLVLATHISPCPAASSRSLFEITSVLNRGGWLGVDLFFVLSGFLVGGLLFREHGQTGAIQYGRFFLRRGFKIYPLLWVAIGLMVLLRAASGHSTSLGSVLPELFFFANYRRGILGVTWSLAVEEHFYLLFPLVLFCLTRFRARSAEPFRPLPWIVAGVALICLGLRAGTKLGANPDDLFHFLFPTQLRLDGLFFGVFLAWCCQYRRAPFLAFAETHRRRLLLYGLLGLLPAFFLSISEWYIRVPGLTVHWLAGGALVTAAVAWQPKPTLLVRALAAAGRQSYATYLLHYWLGNVVLFKLFHALGWSAVPWPLYAATFLVLAFGAGALFTWAVETPMLALRDRLVPATPAPPRLAPAPPPATAFHPA